jgi:putative flippase GtrA
MMIKKISWTELQRIGRFGLVGVAATLVYAASFALSVKELGVSAVIGTTIGYLLSTIISYFGHQGFSFAVSADHADYLPRFAVLSVSSYGINVGMVAVIVDILQFPYQVAVAVLTVLIPIINYFLNRFWVFRRGIHRLEGGEAP